MKSIWYILFLTFILSGCAQSPTVTDETKQKSDISILHTSTDHQQDTSEKVKKLITDEHELKDIVVVNDDRLILIAVDPKHMDRFRLKKLRKTMKNLVESNFSTHEVELSTDKKIILELKKLEKQLTEQTISTENLHKELERIRELSKEQT